MSATHAEIIRCASLSLSAIQREYPFQLTHVVQRADDVARPRELHPAFGAAFDWHSAVHGNWCVVRALRLTNDASFAATAVPVLERHFSPAALAGELDTLGRDGNQGFERPYGLAWLLQLATELREWNDPRARHWLAALAALEQLATERLTNWLPRLPAPVRSGEHSQSAFAMGLALDRARGAGDSESAAIVEQTARRLFLSDRGLPLHLEPSAHDFLSPILAEADLMRRVLPATEFARWFGALLPYGAAEQVLPVSSPDPADGKLSHRIGLNLSRAWMLEGIAASLEDASAGARLEAAAMRHRDAGLADVSGNHYAGSHWLGSFAVYLITRRGIAAS